MEKDLKTVLKEMKYDLATLNTMIKLVELNNDLRDDAYDTYVKKARHADDESDDFWNELDDEANSIVKSFDEQAKSIIEQNKPTDVSAHDWSKHVMDEYNLYTDPRWSIYEDNQKNKEIEADAPIAGDSYTVGALYSATNWLELLINTLTKYSTSHNTVKFDYDIDHKYILSVRDHNFTITFEGYHDGSIFRKALYDANQIKKLKLENTYGKYDVDGDETNLFKFEDRTNWWGNTEYEKLVMRKLCDFLDQSAEIDKYEQAQDIIE